MILIDKEESQKIRESFPHAEIIRTCIQKSKRHHYYLPEKEAYLRLIVDSNYRAREICAEREAWREKYLKENLALEDTMYES